MKNIQRNSSFLLSKASRNIYNNQNNLDFDLSDNYILKLPADYNFNLLNLKNLNFYDIDNRNHLIYNLSDSIIKIAEKYEHNLIEINQFRNM